MMLKNYIHKLSNLRTHKNRNRYPAYTSHRAPDKPFLLLSIMDLIAQGAITDNFIKPSFELVEMFNGYWNRIMPLGSKTSMAYPFPRLKTDGFWELIPNPGYEKKISINFSSMTKVREVCAGARMDEELFRLMCKPETREQLRAALIETYFAPEIRSGVLEQSHLNYAAYQYSEKLLKVAEGKKDFGKATDESDWQKKIRDSGFRRTIVTLYRHRCALCGIRMLTPEGHTIVDAAHIKPWKNSFDDRPTNGMALCKLCHWSFDKGLMSVSKEYQVLVSKRVMLEQNFPGHILTLTDRPIFTPEKESFRPAQDNLHWHRKNTFRK
ncbi:MAG: HNH endonuclease [Desulfobacterales bacterium]